MDAEDRRASPTATSRRCTRRDLGGLPPAVVVTAGDDALRAEGDAYAERLCAAGVAVTHRCEPGLPHGFVQGADHGELAATDRLIADVGRVLGVPAAAAG